MVSEPESKESAAEVISASQEKVLPARRWRFLRRVGWLTVVAVVLAWVWNYQAAEYVRDQEKFYNELGDAGVNFKGERFDQSTTRMNAWISGLMYNNDSNGVLRWCKARLGGCLDVGVRRFLPDQVYRTKYFERWMGISSGGRLTIDVPLSEQHWRRLAQSTELNALKLLGSDVKDSQFELISRMSWLRELKIDAKNLTQKSAESLRRLKGLDRLEVINLSSLVHWGDAVSSLSNLTLLDLRYEGGGDHGSLGAPISVSGLKRLRFLSFRHGQVNIEMWQEITQLLQLRVLLIYDSKFDFQNGQAGKNSTADPLPGFEHLVELEQFNVFRCGCTDEEVIKFRLPKKLSALGLDGNPVTEKTLNHFLRLKHPGLQLIMVKETKIPRSVAEEFSKRHPHLEAFIY